MADDVIRIIVEPDTSGFQRDLDSELATVRSDVEVPVDADTTEATVKVKAFKKAAESDEVEIPVDIDHRGLVTGWRATLRRMERDTKKSSKGMKGDLAQSTVEFQRIAQITMPMALISGIGALAGAAGALAAGAVAAIGPVVQLGAGIASMPAIIGPAVVATKSLGFALEGVDDALGGLHETIDEDKFAELTPEAQRLVRVLDDLKAPTIELQRILQERLFPAFEDGLERLAVFGPAVRGVGEDVGDAIARMVENTSLLITNPFYSGLIVRQMETIGPTVDSLGTSVTFLALAFLRVVDAATPFTTYLLNGFQNWSKGLLDASTDAAGLRNFFLELRGTASVVLGLMGNLMGLMGNVFSAATPTGLELLSMLNAVVERTRAFTGSVEGRNALHEYFQATKPTIIEIAKLLRDVGKAILEFATDPSIPSFIAQIRTDLLPAIVDLLTTANQNLPALTDAAVGLVKFFEQIAPAAQVAAESIASVVGPVASFLAQNPSIKALVVTVLGLGTAFALLSGPVKIVMGLLKPLAPIFKVLGGLLKPVARLLASGLGKAIMGLVRFIPMLVTGIGALVAAIGIVPILIGAVVVGLGVLIYKSQTVREFLIFLGVQLLTFFTNIPKWVGQAVTAVGNFLASLPGHFSRAFNAAVQFVQTALTWYFRLVTFIPRKTIAALASLLSLLVNFYRRVWTAAFNVVKNIVTTIIAFVAAIPGRIITAITSLASRLWTFITNVWNRVHTITTSIVGRIIEFVRSIPGKVVSAIGSVARLLYDKGKDIFDGLLDGLKAGWEKVKDWLGKVGGWIKDLKGPIEVDRALLVDEGKAIMDGFHKGLKSKWDGVEGWLSERGGFIKGMLSKVGLADVTDQLGKLFAGEVSIADVNATLEKHALDGMHPSSGPADTLAMANIIAKRFGVLISSFLRPGARTTTGNLSQHAVGMAADFSNGSSPTPQMDALAEWARKLIGKAFYQVLYRTMLGGNHFNHVHIGWIPRRHGGNVRRSGHYMTGEEGPEPFIPNSSGFILSNARLDRMLNVDRRLGMLERGSRASTPQPAGANVQQHVTINMPPIQANDGQGWAMLTTNRLLEMLRANATTMVGGVA